MYNIIIYDDDPQGASELHADVERLLPTTQPCKVFEVTSFAALTDLITSHTRIDILITDIVMPEGQPTGIEIVRRLFPVESGTQVIYVSGYLDQSLEVYPTNHLYFLLKPVDEQKLGKALNLALLALSRQQPSILRIKVGHSEQLINIATIAYLESNLHKVGIHCRDAFFETYTRLDELQSQLPPSFVRCHRSFIVNLAYVVSLDKDTIHLQNGTNIPVSRSRIKEVQHALIARITGRNPSSLPQEAFEEMQRRSVQ